MPEAIPRPFPVDFDTVEACARAHNDTLRRLIEGKQRRIVVVNGSGMIEPYEFTASEVQLLAMLWRRWHSAKEGYLELCRLREAE